MEFKVSKATIVELLLDGIAIDFSTDTLQEPYSSLVSGGYANYQKREDGRWFICRNWKTEYWREPEMVPIESRFDILDIR